MKGGIILHMKKLITLCLFLLISIPSFALADLGPKPTADIVIEYNNAPINDSTFSAKMLSCNKNIDKSGPEISGILPQLDINQYD